MKRKLLALASLAAVATISLFGGASVALANHEPACTATPYVWFYSEGYPQNQTWADEIKFCFGQYPNGGFPRLVDIKTDSAGGERCQGFLGVDLGHFSNCLSSLLTSTTGWSNGRTLCIYNDEFYSKSGGWSSISSNIGGGNLGSSLSDKISSVKWVTGGSGNC